MKKFIIAAMLLLGACYSTSAQSFTLKGNTYEATSTAAKSDTVVTKYFWKDAKGSYPIILNKRTTRCWVRKPNCKTKTYLPEEVEKDVCRKLGITYIPKKKKASK